MDTGTGEDSFHLGIKALIQDAQGNILLLQVNPANLRGEQQKYWDLPGGRVQKGDSILGTLTREIAEETSVQEVSNVKEIGMVLSNIRIPVGNDTVGLILGIYACTITDSSSITLSDEHIAYDWFTPKNAAKLLAVKYPEHFCELVAAL